LSTPGLRLIAVANPKLAPYGAATEATLRGAGLLDSLRPKLVLTENIGQAAQYAYSGVVDAGFVALSQVHSQALKGAGRHWEVPAKAHPPILQCGLILARTSEPAAAKAFRAFLLGPQAQATLRATGYQSP
jgi:molybdate transport system substrate-binding protein